MRRKRFNSGHPICRIDVTAFAALMFALVAMFLLPASIVIDHHGSSVDLVRVSHARAMPGALREDALFLAIQRDGRIWFDEEKITPDHLSAEIRERVARGAEPKVYIRVDARAKYGDVIQVLHNVRSAGIDDVAFLVNERNPESAP